MNSGISDNTIPGWTVQAPLAARLRPSTRSSFCKIAIPRSMVRIDCSRMGKRWQRLTRSKALPTCDAIARARERPSRTSSLARRSGSKVAFPARPNTGQCRTSTGASTIYRTTERPRPRTSSSTTRVGTSCSVKSTIRKMSRSCCKGISIIG